MAQHFFFRLLPPRPSFVQDMTADERSLMMQHATYMQAFFEAGKVLAFGPVLDPAGSFGMGLLEMETMGEAESLAAGDPTIQAGLNTYSIVPMILGASQAPHRA